jgi:hypothetical protein
MHVAAQNSQALSDDSHGMQAAQIVFMLCTKDYFVMFHLLGVLCGWWSVPGRREASRGLAGHRENHTSSAHESRACLTFLK